MSPVTFAPLITSERLDTLTTTMWRWYCADGSVLPLAYGEVGYADGSFDGSKFIDAQGKPSHVKSVRIAEVKFGSCSNFTFDFDGQTAERWLAPTDQCGRQHVFGAQSQADPCALQAHLSLCCWSHSNAICRSSIFFHARRNWR